MVSVARTFEDLGLAVPDDEEMNRFIGPPIIDSFRRNNVPEELIERAVTTYRDYYMNQPIGPDPINPDMMVSGCYMCDMYDGIIEQLDDLRAKGYILAIASCKPEYQARPVCEHNGIINHLDFLFGASRDTSRIHKEQVIAYGFKQIGFDAEAGDRALMVGDRWTDVDGALACGLDCLGCGWGYAEGNELINHGAYRVIDKTHELSAAVEAYYTYRAS